MSRQLITSALPYINGVKHLGNLVGSMLPADVYARFCRLRGDEVLLICATDEHGTPAELAARDAGLDVAEFCRQSHEIQAELCERFSLSWDHFGRTSRQPNHDLTRHFADRLTENGLIDERVISQIYSLTDQRFLPDRYIEGTCPNCGYERARGDQCENCTKQLDPTDLINPRSAISGSTDLETRQSRHLFLRQSAMAERLRTWIDTKVGSWPVLSTSIAYKWLDEGLEDRGITRDLSWGVAVNRPGFEGKVYYVWFDAPIGYIAATVEWAEAAPAGEVRDWERWWRTERGASDVTYTEFMAKDNIPFHTLGFPTTIMGSGEDWKLVDELKAFNWLTYYGGKFSTSAGRGVFMDSALELRPSDCWRWYLMSNAPENDDSSFTWELFAEAVNKDLVATFGNFVNRTATQVSRHFGDVVPAGGETDGIEADLISRLTDLVATYVDQLDHREFRKSSQTLRSIWSEGNVYLEQREPWRSIKVDPDRTAATLRTALGVVRLHGHLSSPFVPDAAARLLAMFPEAAPLDGLGPDVVTAAFDLAPGSALVLPGLLFDKVSDDEVAEWSERFGAAES